MVTQGVDHYRQDLRRAIGLIGNTSITLSFLTPTASLFLTASVLLTLNGSATFLSFVFAGVAALGMALCFAEMGSAFPVVGGQYSIVMRVLGRPLGFLAFVLFVVLGIFTISATSLVVGIYLQVIWPDANSALVGSLMIAGATLVGVFGIRFNAVVTGLFLLLELIVVLIVSVTGLVHVHQPVSTLFDLRSFDAKGNPIAIGFGGMVAGIAIAMFAYNGYDTAIVFSEETQGRRTMIARAVLTSFFIALVAEVVAVTATLLGASSLVKEFNSSAPISYMLTANGGTTLNTLVSLGVALAIFNADIAAVLAIGRVIYSSARDRAWPDVINRWVGDVHPRLKTPWIATTILGVACTVLTAASNIATLVTFVGVVLIVLYAMVAISAFVSRFTQRNIERPFKMPFWPLPIVIALVGIGMALSQQKVADLVIVAGILLASAIYYVAYLQPRSSTHWLKLDPLPMEETAPVARVAPVPTV